MIVPLERQAFKKILKGLELTLIKAETAHASSLWDYILRDRDARDSSWKWLKSREHLEEFLHQFDTELPGDEIVYLIQQNLNIIGSFHIFNFKYRDHKVEIGCGIEKTFEGNGKATAAFILVEAELRRLGFNKIEASCNTENLKSIRSAERNGFLREGTRLQDKVENGKFRDSAIFGKLLS